MHAVSQFDPKLGEMKERCLLLQEVQSLPTVNTFSCLASGDHKINFFFLQFKDG